MNARRRPILTFNISSLLLLFTCLIVCGSWWLDHRRLERKISIEVENQRIIGSGIQGRVNGFDLSLKSNGYVFELSSAEEKLSVEISSDESRFMEIVRIVGLWEASRLKDQDYDRVVSICRRRFKYLANQKLPLPAITVSPQSATSLVQFTKDCGIEDKINIQQNKGVGDRFGN